MEALCDHITRTRAYFQLQMNTASNQCNYPIHDMPSLASSFCLGFAFYAIYAQDFAESLAVFSCSVCNAQRTSLEPSLKRKVVIGVKEGC